MAINVQQKYQQNQITTATPQELVLLLYNGGIKYCNLARSSIEQKSLKEAHNALIRVQDILTELQLGLNKNIEISKNLDALYDFMKNRIMEANIKKDVAIIEEVKDFFVEFRDTWKQAIEIAKKQTVKLG